MRSVSLNNGTRHYARVLRIVVMSEDDEEPGDKNKLAGRELTEERWRS